MIAPRAVLGRVRRIALGLLLFLLLLGVPGFRRLLYKLMPRDSVEPATRASLPPNTPVMLDSHPAEETSPSGRPRLLLPREHGAYAELLFPLLTALALGNFNMAQWLLAFAAVAVFLAHESLLIIVGDRGSRARSQLMGQAKWTSAVLLAIACTTAAFGLWQAPAATFWAVLIPVCSTVLLIPLIISHREKTLAGEFLVALIFSTALIPIALAGAVVFETATAAAGVWFAVFAIETLTVRAVKAHLKPGMERARLTRAIMIFNLSLAVVAILLFLNREPLFAPIAAIVPAALVALACVWLRVHPRHLRTLGWALVTCDLIALIMLTASLS